MRKFTFISLQLLVFALVLNSCNSCFSTENKVEKDIEESMENIGEEMENIGKKTEESMEEALENVGKTLENLTKKDGEKVEPINFRELRKIAPEKLAGLERTDVSGQTSGALGIKVSVSEATYKEGNKKIELKITDTGGLGMAIAGMANWSTIDIDKETKDGYERTTEYKGHKAFEKYNSKRQRGEFSIIVANRFIVLLEGINIAIDELKKAIKQLDLDELEDMAKD